MPKCVLRRWNECRRSNFCISDVEPPLVLSGASHLILFCVATETDNRLIRVRTCSASIAGSRQRYQFRRPMVELAPARCTYLTSSELFIDHVTGTLEHSFRRCTLLRRAPALHRRGLNAAATIWTPLRHAVALRRRGMDAAPGMERVAEAGGADGNGVAARA